jgi:glucose-6-phosphate dehydrogenase assembly protein OpcA
MGAVENFTAGVEVGINSIDRELKKLWQEGGGLTRASLINLAVYCGERSMEVSTELISRITRNHACRAILIASDPTGGLKDVRAWISAHCHISRAGAKQVCSEQITFLLPKDSNWMIPNIVFSHLDSDLPLYLWWQGEFPSDTEMPLLKWVDRLIFDSREWENCSHALCGFPDRIKSLAKRMTFRDINWTRSLSTRQALARFFDNPDNLPALYRLTRVHFDYAPGFRSLAALVVGWLASHLAWTVSAGKATTPNGAEIEIILNEKEGTALNGGLLEAGARNFRLSRHEGSDFIRAEVFLEEGFSYEFLVPASGDDTLSMINVELGRGSGHQNYLSSLNAALPVLSSET